MILKKKYGLYTAVSIVIANMIGTGVFTSLGFQVKDLHSGFTVLFLWLIGGISALAGALVYAELGSKYPRSGGEYNFLSRIYNPAFGFMAGWVSFLVGFAAPIAAASIAFGKYLCISTSISDSNAKIFAVLVIVAFTLLHSLSRRAGALFQNIFTTIKILTIIVLIALGFVFGQNQGLDFSPNINSFKEIISPNFAIALYFVAYSYSGWNAAAYISSEIELPEKNVPRSLISATSIVIVLYLLLNFIFLYTVPIGDLAGQLEIGYVFGSKILGGNAGVIMGIIFSVLLFATISSLIITGPRVSQVIGDDYAIFKWFSIKSKNNLPVNALIVQGVLAIFYVLTSTFEQMITYIGFTLNLFKMLAVIGIFISRKKHSNIPTPYKIPIYPLTPIIFLAINLWILVYGLIYVPYESLAGIVTALLGLGLYYISKRWN